MQIEKVSFYKVGAEPSRSNFAVQNKNVVSISLPRLRWLEADGPYRPRWAIDYTPPVPQPDPKVVEIKTKEKKVRQARRLNPMGRMMSDREKTALDLYLGGMRVREIADRLNWTLNAAKDTVRRGKLKAGIIEYRNIDTKTNSG